MTRTITATGIPDEMLQGIQERVHRRGGYIRALVAKDLQRKRVLDEIWERGLRPCAPLDKR